MIPEVTDAGRVSYTLPNKIGISYSNYYKFRGSFKVDYIIKSPANGLPVWLNTCYGYAVWDDIKNIDTFFLVDNSVLKCANKDCREQNQGSEEVLIGLTFFDIPAYRVKFGDILYYDILS